MAGRIKAEDIASVKERTSIEDVVRDHVTLRPAGVGSLKGLCPFHDEKTPSFTVRPAVGSYHCFGCGEGGDVISFVQKVEHLTFTESVERLAAKLGIELRYEDGRRPPRRRHVARAGARGSSRPTGWPRSSTPRSSSTRRARSAGPVATSCASAASTRPLPSASASASPRGDGEALTRHLRERGFTEDEIVTGGLSGRGSRGLYDRFRGRLVWPIRDTTGDTVGFGARRLFDDDRIAAKYLNTSETPIYKKSQVLYGLDAAKKAISTERRAVVVEGYTDVMAAHLAGRRGGGRHLRHGLRRRPHQDPAPHHARRDRRPPGPGHLHLRRRRRRPEGRDEGVRRGPALGRPVVRRRRARRHGPVRPAAGQGGCRGARPRRRRRADVRVRRAHDDPALRPRHRRGPGPGDEGRRADHRLDPRHEPAPRVHPHRVRLAGHRGRADGRRGPQGRAGAPRRPRRPLAPPGRHRRGARARSRRGRGLAAGARPARPGRVHRAPAAPGARSSTRSSSTTPPSTRCAPRPSRRPPTGPCSTASGSRRRPRDGRRPRRGSPPSAEAAPLAVRGLVSELSVAPLPTRYDSRPGCRRSATSTRSSPACATPTSDASSPTRWPRCAACRTTPSPTPPTSGSARWPCTASSSNASPCARACRREAAVDRAAPAPRPRRRGRGDRPRGAREAPRLGGRDGIGTTVVAGRHRLYAVAPGPDGPRVTLSRPWHLVDAGLWSGEDGSLRVTWVDGERPARFVLTEPGMLPETLRERVQASVVLAEALDLGGRRTARVVVRKDLATGRADQPGAARAGGPQHRPGGRGAGPRGPGPGARAGRPRADPTGRFRGGTSSLLSLPGAAAAIPWRPFPCSSIGRAAGC